MGYLFAFIYIKQCILLRSFHDDYGMRSSLQSRSILPINPKIESSYFFTKKGHELHLVIASPSEEEILQVQDGEAEFALAYERDILFFLCRFDSTGWSHSVFQWYQIPLSERALPQIWGHWEKAASLHIFLHNKETSKMITKRVLEFSSVFTTSLYGMIILQASQLWMGTDAFEKQLLNVYQDYPSSDALLQIATARTLHSSKEAPFK